MLTSYQHHRCHAMYVYWNTRPHPAHPPYTPKENFFETRIFWFLKIHVRVCILCALTHRSRHRGVKHGSVSVPGVPLWDPESGITCRTVATERLFWRTGFARGLVARGCRSVPLHQPTGYLPCSHQSGLDF